LKHIVVCLPFARDYIYCDFMVSWTKMFMYARDKYNLSLTTIVGPYIDDNRERLVRTAMPMEPDYLLFIDDDQTYPANTPEILMNHIDSGKLIVGGITPMKETCAPMIWDCDDASKEINLWSELEGKTGLVKIDGFGMGGVMIHHSVFYKIDPPYFRGDHADSWRKRGEDIEFYLKCREAGIGVWADLDLQFGHITTREVRIGDQPRKKADSRTSYSATRP